MHEDLFLSIHIYRKQHAKELKRARVHSSISQNVGFVWVAGKPGLVGIYDASPEACMVCSKDFGEDFTTVLVERRIDLVREHHLPIPLGHSASCCGHSQSDVVQWDGDSVQIRGKS